jgi:hypothetical protein
VTLDRRAPSERAVEVRRDRDFQERSGRQRQLLFPAVVVVKARAKIQPISRERELALGTSDPEAFVFGDQRRRDAVAHRVRDLVEQHTDLTRRCHRNECTHGLLLGPGRRSRSSVVRAAAPDERRQHTQNTRKRQPKTHGGPTLPELVRAELFQRVVMRAHVV